MFCFNGFHEKAVKNGSMKKLHLFSKSDWEERNIVLINKLTQINIYVLAVNYSLHKNYKN